jgi:hypothetical protein
MGWCTGNARSFPADAARRARKAAGAQRRDFLVNAGGSHASNSTSPKLERNLFAILDSLVVTYTGRIAGDAGDQGLGARTPAVLPQVAVLRDRS